MVPALAEDVDPEVAHGGVEVRKIHLELGLERPGLLLAHELVGHAADGVDVHRLVGQGRDDPVHLHADRRAARDEEVRRLLFGHQLEQSVEIHLGRLRATMTAAARGLRTQDGASDRPMPRSLARRRGLRPMVLDDNVMI
jgi:hypothetical protein